MSAMEKPLSGIRVLDFTRVLAGPYCSMLLADLGADVVKIETPGDGDLTRRQGPPFHHDMGMTYLAANRNKRSLTLNLRSDEGKAIATRLALQADIVLENFRPSIMAKMGLDFETLARDNPKLIYAAISGMGATGPDKDMGAFDLTIQAIGGYMSINGEPGGKPIKLGNSAIDLVCGINAHASIMAALIHRGKTGKGQKIETSLLETQVSFLANTALDYLISQKLPRKWGSEHPQQVPYKAFETADGWLIIGAGFQALFEKLATVLQRRDLLDDPRYGSLAARVENRGDLYRELDGEIRKCATNELCMQLEAVGIPCAPVNDLQQVFEHRQVKHHGMVMSVEHPAYGAIPQVGPASSFSGFDIKDGWTPPPLLGEHSAEVLREWLGIPADQVRHLQESGVV